MSDPAEMAERRGRILAELSELGLALARDLQARALAADDAETAAELGSAFHRVSRSVRQTLALEARLERDRQRQDREARAESARDDEARVQRRKAQVRAAVERLIWTEAEGEEAERLADELGDRLDEEALYDGFEDDPVEAHIERIRSELGLSDPSPLAGEGGRRRRPDDGPHKPSSGSAGLGAAFRDDEAGNLRGPSSDPLRGPPSPAGGERNGLWRSSA